MNEKKPGNPWAKSLMISVLRDNIPARGFYEHLGGHADAPRCAPRGSRHGSQSPPVASLRRLAASG